MQLLKQQQVSNSTLRKLAKWSLFAKFASSFHHLSYHPLVPPCKNSSLQTDNIESNTTKVNSKHPFWNRPYNHLQWGKQKTCVATKRRTRFLHRRKCKQVKKIFLLPWEGTFLISQVLGKWRSCYAKEIRIMDKLPL